MLEDARLTSFLEYSTNECDDIFQMLIISRAIELISLISGLESFNKKLLNVKLTSQQRSVICHCQSTHEGTQANKESFNQRSLRRRSLCNLIKNFLINQKTFLEQVHSLGYCQRYCLFMAKLLYQINIDRVKIWCSNSLDEDVVNEPAQVNSRILNNNLLQFLKLGLEIILASVVTDKLDRLLAIIVGTGHIRIFYNIFKSYLSIFLYGFLKLCLNLLLHLQHLLINLLVKRSWTSHTTWYLRSEHSINPQVRIPLGNISHKGRLCTHISTIWC